MAEEVEGDEPFNVDALIKASGVLSPRLSLEYMLESKGGIDPPEESERERLQHVEAYNFEFTPEEDVCGRSQLHL